MTATKLARKPRPTCGHVYLRECPLTVADWEQAFHAYLAFRFQCALISERAHARLSPSTKEGT